MFERVNMIFIWKCIMTVLSVSIYNTGDAGQLDYHYPKGTIYISSKFDLNFINPKIYLNLFPHFLNKFTLSKTISLFCS